MPGRALLVALLIAATAPLAPSPAAAAPRCLGGTATIVGTGGRDVLIGTPGPDVIIGRGGRDRVNGGDGNDRICGRSGADVLSGGDGDDRLAGGRRPDTIDGDYGADQLSGGRGTDTCFQGQGHGDTVSCVPVIAAAGDIACEPWRPETPSECRMRATSDLLLRTNLSAVLALGDNQYENGEYSNFLASYDPTWGRVRPITHPSPGNHDYGTPAAAGYFAYFGGAAGDPLAGHYSFDIGSWHLVALNSNCGEVGGCGGGSPQVTWLKADLAAHTAPCTLAFWHHPRFSSGWHGSDASVAGLWQELHSAGAEVVLAGHDHDYERFAPQDANGGADPTGIREFVVGTGGRSLREFGAVADHSQVRIAEAFGVLELALRPNGYAWRFVPEPGEPFTDSGSDHCH